MTETEFAQSFARQLRERIVAQHGQEVAALLGAEWFDSVGVAVTEFAASVAASARREALAEATDKAEEHCAELLEGMSQAAHDDDSRTHDRLNHAYGEARHILEDLRALSPHPSHD